MDETLTELCGRKGHVFTTFATEYSSTPEIYFEPNDVGQLKRILSMAKEKAKTVKVVGAGQSLIAITQGKDYMISMKHFNKVIEIDQKKKTVLAEGGILLSDLIEELARNGLAFSSLPMMADLSLAGLICTGTRGTGLAYQSLSSMVLELTLLKADGQVVTLTRENDDNTFLAACLSLGALGIILSVKMQCEGVFNLHKVQYGTNLETALSQLDTDAKRSQHYLLLMYPYTNQCIAATHDRTDEEIRRPGWLGETVAGFVFGPLWEFLAWLSLAIPWIIPYFTSFYCWLMSGKQDMVDRSDKLIVVPYIPGKAMEFFLPMEKVKEVVLNLKVSLEQNVARHHFWIVARLGKKEDLLLSPSYGKDTCGLMFICHRPRGTTVKHELDAFKVFEDLGQKAGGRPHWGKFHMLTARDLQKMYPEWDEFRRIRDEMDPGGLFLNPHLKKILGINP